MNVDQMFAQSLENLLDDRTRRERAAKAELARRVKSWLSRNGYTMDDYLSDPKVAYDCVVGIRNGE